MCVCGCDFGVRRARANVKYFTPRGHRHHCCRSLMAVPWNRRCAPGGPLCSTRTSTQVPIRARKPSLVHTMTWTNHDWLRPREHALTHATDTLYSNHQTKHKTPLGAYLGAPISLSFATRGSTFGSFFLNKRARGPLLLLSLSLSLSCVFPTEGQERIHQKKRRFRESGVNNNIVGHKKRACAGWEGE